MHEKDTAERRRLAQARSGQADWRKWGPYLSERAWGTVREDYSPGGSAWDYFPHDHARSRAYRWNEDGLGGVSNDFQNVCLAVALWNEKDPILKERLFGLTGSEGNHGEDVKEYYFYLDNTPTHSYMKMLYKYPQVAFPYAQLVESKRHRDRRAPEFELLDALHEAFAKGRYFDVFIEWAKASPEDLLLRIIAVNHGTQAASIHILPHVWFRNTWSWGYGPERPSMQRVDGRTISVEHKHLGQRYVYVDGDVPLLFTENDTNYERIFGGSNGGAYVKDGINEAVVNGQSDRVNPAQTGTKAAAHFQASLASGASFTVRLRFAPSELDEPFADFDVIFARRLEESGEFYNSLHPTGLSDEERQIQRQALAGLLWSKQFYHYNVELWLKGDPAQLPPPTSRRQGRNHEWGHLDNLDVLSMPDKWEYPWYAAWDLAFHMIPLAMVDPDWAKSQLILLLREWYMHPSGQLPAYEWAYGDVNPPVHAWAALKVYQIDREMTGQADVSFLERVFHKLLLNFTWWVNRKDMDGRNVFQGGFLGLDNIGVFDRSKALPTGGYLDQADGTAWMAMYCLNLLAISLELGRYNPSYEDVATKFFEHFIYIANAFYNLGDQSASLWNEEDGFFYDGLHTPEGEYIPLKVRSFVGLIPLFAVESLEPEVLEALPKFKGRLEWFIKYRPWLVKNVASLTEMGAHGHYQLAVVGREKLERILERVCDPQEFLSDYGLRSISRFHAENPYTFNVNGQEHRVDYEPGESSSGLFGGNSNWRGPIWFPVNYLLIDSLRKFGHHYADSLQVEMPRGSGQMLNLGQAADELSRRLVSVFQRDSAGRRPVFGAEPIFQNDPHWRDCLLFYEYFHGDNGAGVGASHQTGWTALVAQLVAELKGMGLAERGEHSEAG
jgi:hypothetical protein